MLGTAKVRKNASSRARGVERGNSQAGLEVDDAQMVAHRIEATDLGEVRRVAHQTGVTRGRPAPVVDEVTKRYGSFCRVNHDHVRYVLPATLTTATRSGKGKNACSNYYVSAK